MTKSVLEPIAHQSGVNSIGVRLSNLHMQAKKVIATSDYCESDSNRSSSRLSSQEDSTTRKKGDDDDKVRFEANMSSLQRSNQENKATKFISYKSILGNTDQRLNLGLSKRAAFQNSKATIMART